jgi:hypothetical protein
MKNEYRATVEWYWQRKSEEVEKSLSECRFIHCKSYMDWLGREYTPLWEASISGWIHFTPSHSIYLRIFLILSSYLRLFALMMKVVPTSETSVYCNETTRRKIPEGSHLVSTFSCSKPSLLVPLRCCVFRTKLSWLPCVCILSRG